MLCAQITDQTVICHVWVDSEETRLSLLELCDYLIEITEPLPVIGSKYINGAFTEGE